MKILIPTDGSALALDAVHHVLALLRAGLRAELVLANVQEPTHLYELLMTSDEGTREAAARAAGEHALQPAEALLRAAGIDFTSEIAVGEPAHTLLSLAEREGCDVVVIGSHGTGGLRKALLGSVSERLVRDARLPVTVVPHAAPDEVAAEVADAA